MKNLFVLLAMVFVPMLASAERGENELRISNIQTEAGQQVKLTVELVNENTISGIGAYLTLPEGITMEDISIVPGRWNDVFTQAFAKTKDGRYKFAVITWEKNDYIQAGEGNIFTITLNVGKDVAEGVYDILLEDIQMSVKEDGDKYLQGKGNKYMVVQNVGKASLEIKSRGEATGIDNVPGAVHKDAGIYDLTGRRLRTAPQKGVYIQGKKKMVAK